MATMISCPYCLRTEVQASPPYERLVLSEGDIRITANPRMCIDCALVVGKFVSKGLSAFRKELSRLRDQNNAIQLDLFQKSEDLDPTRGAVEDFLESL